MCLCPVDVIYNNVGNCVLGWDSGGFWFFYGKQKTPGSGRSGRRTRGTTRHSPVENTRQAHSLPTMPLSQNGNNRGGKKSAHSITGVPGFSYVYRFSRHYGGDTRGQHLRRMWGGKRHFRKAAPGPLPRTLRKPYTDRLLSARNGFVYSVPSTRCGYRNRRYR